MACFWLKQHETTVKIPSIQEKDGIIYYKIHVAVGDVKWEVLHRYNDFFELHSHLMVDHGISKDILPAKKVIGSKSPEFIEIRRKGLESYLIKVLNFLKLTMPRIFIEFLNFHYYDVFFLLQSLAVKFYTHADNILSVSNKFNFNIIEMHAISACFKLPLPTESVIDKQYDFTHVLDFCSQMKMVDIKGSFNTYLQSNIVPNTLPFSLRNFKNIQILQLEEVCLDSIKDVGNLRNKLTDLTVVKSRMSHLSQILQCDVLHKSNLNNTQIWSNIVMMDLSYNFLTEIDQSIKLVPNLKHLVLNQNRFSSIPDLSCLTKLQTLSVCGNLITICNKVHQKLGNIINLNLAQNNITSLEGFSNLPTLQTLDLTCNAITNIEEIRYLSNIGKLQEINLTGNYVSTVIDYRIKVFEYFGGRAHELCLDNEQPSQQELDKVSIRKALKILNSGGMPDIMNTKR